MNKILSVSVAAYNLEKLITTNILSFCNQKSSNKVELIVVDDGSKDNTTKIVEQLIKKCPDTVVLIKKKNEGPGSTINAALSVATGKFFKMIDGDDWIESVNLDSFISLLEETDADMVLSDYEVFNDSTSSIIERVSFDIPENITLKLSDYYKMMNLQMHGIAYKTSILKQSNIVYDNCFYTDVEYVLLPIPYVSSFIYFNRTLYIYRVAQANQSVNPVSMRKNIEQHNRVLTRLLELYKSLKLTGYHKHIYELRLSSMVDVQLTTLLSYDASKSKKHEIKEFIYLIKNNYPGIYNEFKRSKKFKLLSYSNFILYRFVSYMIRKRK